VKKDIAFTGFRKSCNRMKEASPIASSLYKMVPMELKQFSLYRKLTGEAIGMLKKGAENDCIFETLKRTYIDPLLDIPAEQIKSSKTLSAEKQNDVRGIKDFTRFFPITSTGRRSKIRRMRSQRQFSGIAGFPDSSIKAHTTVTKKTSLTDTNQYSFESAQTFPPTNTIQEPKPGLIYMGRLPECKKLKMWIRSDSSVYTS
jgi:hypothetical protein